MACTFDGFSNYNFGTAGENGLQLICASKERVAEYINCMKQFPMTRGELDLASLYQIATTELEVYWNQTYQTMTVLMNPTSDVGCILATSIKTVVVQ